MNYKYKSRKMALDKLPPNDIIVGPEPDTEFIETINDYGVIYPVIMSDWHDTLHLIDGGRRIKACRILEEEGAKIGNLSVRIYEDINPFDQATWSVILNSQRSINPIAEYLYLSNLRDTEDWDKFIAATRMNPAHAKKIMSLDSLYENSPFLEAYSDGKIAMGTLFEIAKLGEPRQKYLETILVEKDKVTARDVRESKKASTEAVLATLDFEDMPEPEETYPPYYIIFNPKECTSADTIFKDYYEAHEKAVKMNNGSKVYQLVEM